MGSKKKGKNNKGKRGPGKPPKYSDEQVLQRTILEYFKSCKPTKKNYKGLLPNKAGLCAHLGISRDTYSEYRKKYPDTIKKADFFIEDAWVQRLGSNAATGAIFYLKNAFKEEYKDRHIVESKPFTKKDIKEYE